MPQGPWAKEAAKADEELARKTPPTRTIDFYQKGDAAYHVPNYPEALKWFEAGIAIEPTHYWSLFMVGSTHLQSKKPEGTEAAILAFTGCILKRPEYRNAYLARATAYKRLGRFEEALADCDKLIELNPKASSGWNARAANYQALGQWDKALDDYAKGVELSAPDPSFAVIPKNALARFYRGRACQNIGKAEKALENYTKAIELAPTFAIAWNNRGFTHLSLGQLEKAVADFSKAIHLDTETPVYLVNRGSVYDRLGEWAKAIDDYTQFLKVNPSTVQVLERRGRAYGKLGQTDNERADYQRIVELMGKNARALNDWAWQLATNTDLKARNPRGSVELARKAVELEPKVATYRNTLGTAHYRDGAWQASLDALSKAMDLGKGGSGWDWFFVAMAEWQLDRKDEARKEYNRAVQWMNANEPNNAELRRFRAEAAKLLGVKE